VVSKIPTQSRRFLAAAVNAVLFFVLSSLAMLAYPGGTAADTTRPGYSFLTNFFSDLGRTRSISNQPNFVSLILFIFAMACAATSLILFFITFMTCLTSRRRTLHLSRFGALLGIGSAICFVGVAATPWDLVIGPHMIFVLWAFRLFLGAVVLNLLAVIFTPGLPHRFAWIFATFALLLVGYLILLSAGPDIDTPAGLMIQAVGQKLIAYSAVLTVLAQSLIMRQHLLRTHSI
jgi:hypothetical membrane protein